MDRDGPAPPVRDAQAFLGGVERALLHPIRPEKGEGLSVGLDLGTASIVLVVLGEGGRPLAAAREFAQVVRDGLVVDFDRARLIVKALRERLQDALAVELNETAIAVPPGTGARDVATHSYVASGAGLEVTGVMDEPAAANLVLGMRSGAIVDIGGGTTGVSLLKDGRIVHSFDEPTGGTHVTLVLAGHNRISFEEAEALKLDPKRGRENLAVIAPVLRKMGSIIKNGISGFECERIVLVGGTAATEGIEGIIAMETGKTVSVSPVPLLVTPAGIALGNRRT